MVRPPAAIGFIFRIKSNKMAPIKQSLAKVFSDLDYEDRLYTYHPKNDKMFRLPGESVAYFVGVKTANVSLTESIRYTARMVKTEQHSTKHVFCVIDSYHPAEELLVKMQMGNDPLDDYPCEFVFFAMDNCNKLIDNLAQEHCKIIHITQISEITDYIRNLCGNMYEEKNDR